jgi:AcrR family transcriptional regulator
LKTTYHHGELSRALITAALAALEAGEEVSLRGVARAAGVSAMAPYRHFVDKGALLAAVAARGFEALRERLVEADRGAPAEALLAQGRAYVAFARERPALFRLMFAGSPSGTPPEEGSAYGVLAARVASLAPHAGEAGVLSSWGVVHGLAMLALDGRLGSSPEVAIDGALASFVGGLAGRSPTA